jgi:carboxymethylenebutenolidase
MTELEKYLAEEVAEDMADGIISRREAVRRLGLLGVTGAAATGLLAAFASGEAAAAPTQLSGKKVTTWAPVARESITFEGPRVPLLAAWAPAAKPRGAVLVIHENRGLTEHIRGIAGRLAGSGYSALALDLLSEEGGTGAFPDEAAVAAKLSEISGSRPERFDEDMMASVTELRRRVRGKKLAAIGFCFGGAMVWRLLAAGESRLSAAAPFYGPFPEGGDLSEAKAAVLGVYGGLDSRVNATQPAAKAALDNARLEYELLTFTEADHAFFNDTGARFNPPAATEVWRRTLNWFDEATRKH